MAERVIMPPDARAAAERLGMSPAVPSGGHRFFTGVTGSDADGRMPQAPEAQFRNCFERIGLVLGEAGLGFAALVDMTSCHVGLRARLDLFDRIRRGYLDEPHPAWTAVEVAGPRREGAIVEIRVIACADPLT